MADVPLGKSAYRRTYGQEPEIKMVNRFFEQDPTNQVSGTALLSRAGTTLVQSVGDGPIRGLHTRSGAFNSDLFVVSGDSLFRVAPDGTEIAISGTLSSTAGPWMTITTGPGFENLFVSDGDNLFVYEGISCSRGTIEEDSGGSLVDGDQVRIGDTYYQFTTGSVDTGTPDGTSLNPWLVALGTAKASARLVFLNDGRIDIAGYAVFIGEIPDGTPAGEGGDLRFVYTMSDPGELERNNPNGTGNNPWRLATREGITARSYLSLLKSAINATGKPGVDYSRELVQPNEFVTADEIAGGISPANPRDNYLTVRALTGGADGNDIQVRNVLDRAPIFRWEDDAGNPVQSLSGGSDTTADVPSALTNLSRAIDASGIPGVDYSTDLTAHPDARTEFLEGPTLDIVACDGAASNSIVTTTTSTGLSWGAGTLTGGGEHRLDPVVMPDNLPAGSLNTLGGFVTISVYEDDRFYWIRPGERNIDPLNFATAESEPDKIVESLTLADQLVLFGGSTVEFWSATGNPELPFRPSRGQTLDIGAIPNTPAKTSDGLIFVGSDGAVYATSGGPVQKVSTNGIDERVRKQLASAASDEGMQSFTFDQDGHTFFVLHLDPVVPPPPEPPGTVLFVAIGTNDDRVDTVDLNGNLLSRYSEFNQQVLGTAVDPVDGSVYSVGGEGVVHKTDSSANQVWTYTTSGTCYGMAVDSARNVVIASGAGGQGVIKLQPDSTFVFDKSSIGQQRDVAVDSEDNIYTGGTDGTLRKLDSTGAELWSFTGHTDGINQVAVDGDGHVYSSSFDTTIRKITADGSEVWSVSMTDLARAVGVDGEGNVYGGDDAGKVKKFDSSGVELWTFSAPVGESIQKIAVDPESGVYVACNDGLRKLDFDGNELWLYDRDVLGAVFYVSLGTTGDPAPPPPPGELYLTDKEFAVEGGFGYILFDTSGELITDNLYWPYEWMTDPGSLDSFNYQVRLTVVSGDPGQISNSAIDSWIYLDGSPTWYLSGADPLELLFEIKFWSDSDPTVSGTTTVTFV